MSEKFQRTLTEPDLNGLAVHSHRTAFLKRPGHRHTASSPEQLRQMITEKIRKETMDAFGNGTDVITLMRQKRKHNHLDLDSLEGLRFAYDRAIEREGQLNHALSRAQMECDENKFLFREAVDCGEQLRQQNREILAKLDDQLDLVSLLNRDVKNLQAKNIILKEEIEDTKRAENESKRALFEVSKSNNLARAELDEQKKLMSKFRDDQALTLNNYDLDVQEVLDKQDSVLGREKVLRRQVEEALSKAKLKLDENEQEMKSLKKINEDLEDRLAETEHRYREEFSRLCFEKAYQDIDYESLLNEVKRQRVQLKEAHDKLISVGLNGNLEFAPTLDHRSTFKDEGPSLADQIELSVQRNSFRSDDTEGLELEFYERTPTAEDEEKDKDSEGQAPALDLPDIIQTYLNITATAVLLHFPNLRENVVTTNTLTELVQNSPFYLYYDLMMHFMYKKKQEKELEDAKKAALDKSASPQAESSSWVGRLKSLKQSRTIVRKRKRNSWRDISQNMIFLASSNSGCSAAKKGTGDSLPPADSSGKDTAYEAPRTTSYML